MTEPENHTLALLREIRADIARMEERVNIRIDEFESRITKRFDRMEKRVDAMHQNGIKALKGLIGHRAMVERTMAASRWT